jgi:hypothetical protein
MKIELSNESKLALKESLWPFYLLGGILLILGLLVLGAGDKPVVGAGFIIFGIASILLGGTRRILFEKDKKLITEETLRHIRKRKIVFSTDDAVSILQKVSIQRGSTSRSGGAVIHAPSKPVYDYYLQFKDSRSIFLGRVTGNLIKSITSSVSGVGGSSIPLSVQAVANFLNIPIAEDKLGQNLATAAAVGGIVGQFLKK